MHRRLLGSVLVLLTLALAPGTAGASVIVGNPAPSTTNLNIGNLNPIVQVQTALPGALLSSPVNGVVIRWSIRGTASNSNENIVTLRVLRPAGAEFIGAGSSAPQPLPNAATDSVLRSFATSLPIQLGDQIGLGTTANTALPAGPATPGTSAESFSDFSDGTSSGPPLGSNGRELPFNAEVEPTNTFSLSAIHRNKRNGTASVTANLPNPGTFEVQGGLIAQQTVDVAGPGDVALALQPTKPIRKQLKKRGKAAVDATFVYAPIFGKHRAQPVTFTLKQKRKKRR